MFILFMCLVSMNLLMIRTEEDIVRIDIKAGEQLDKCIVLSEVYLHMGKKFTLQIRSDYFIKKSSWNRKGSNQHLQDLDNSVFSITYERTKSSGKQNNIFVYTYSHTGKADDKSGGKWNFTFELLTNYDPWSVPQKQDVQSRSCSTDVWIDPSKPKDHHSTTSESPETRNSPGGKDKHWLIVLVSVFGILLVVQSSFMLFWRVRNPLSLKSLKAKRGSKARGNIAGRPPLPLPLDEVVKKEPMPPVSLMSLVPKRHLSPLVSKQSYRNKGLHTSDVGVKSPVFARRRMEGPLVPKQSYRNKALDNSDKEPRSPGFPRRHEGPLVPKQSYRNKGSDNSDEDPRTPSFSRRHLEAKLAQLPPKGVAASKSFKYSKPLPRLPQTPPLEEVPAFHPAHRQEPAPPLHPKNLQVFPPPAPCRPRLIVNPESRLSDDVWQYEELQPACKYLDNFNDTPDNIV